MKMIDVLFYIAACVFGIALGFIISEIIIRA